MSKSATASPVAQSPPATESAPDESAIHAERLHRSVRVTTGLLRAVADSRKLLARLAAPFLELATEKDSEKRTSDRKARRRDAIFAAAKVALDPDYATGKIVDELLTSADDLDAPIGSNARDVKSKVLEPLDELIKCAHQEANEEKSAESVDQFKGQIQALLAEMDLRSHELTTLHKVCKAQLRQARIARLATTTNIVIAIVVLLLVVIGSIGYAAKVRKQHREAEAAAHAKATPASSKKDDVAVHPEHDAASEKPVAVGVTEDPVPAKLAESAPSPARPQGKQVDAKVPGGTATLSSGQSKEETKEGLKALSDAIKAWNAESDARSGRKSEPSKASQ